MALPGIHQSFDLFHAADTTSGTNRSTVQRGGSTGKVQLAIEGPGLQQPENESGMENIACASSVCDFYPIGGRVMELFTVPCEHAIFSKRGCCQTTTKTKLDLPKRLFQVFGLHQTAGKITAHNQVVNLFDQCLNAGVQLIQVGNHRNTGFSRPLGCQSGRCRVISIYMQGPCVYDPLA